MPAVAVRTGGYATSRRAPQQRNGAGAPGVRTLFTKLHRVRGNGERQQAKARGCSAMACRARREGMVARRLRWCYAYRLPGVVLSVTTSYRHRRQPLRSMPPGEWRTQPLDVTGNAEQWRARERCASEDVIGTNTSSQ